jgi:hypothetical protein
MIHLLFVSFLLILATLFALVEIQVEGAYGWAEHLPTWRVSNRLTQLFYSGRPLTGYHLYVQVFLLIMVHVPFGLNLIPFSWPIEARLIAFYALFWTAEDFLWFVLNPAYGIGRFRKEYIWWHAPSWCWIAPRDYWVWIPTGIALYIASYRF